MTLLPLPALAIVVPAWNEEQRIGRTLDHLLRVGVALGIEEVIVVDDGSTDETPQILDRRAEAQTGPPRLHVIHHATNQGKGGALRTGLLAAKSPLVGYLDADLSVGTEGIPPARDLIAQGADVVAGYRLSYTGLPDGKGQPPLRRALSILFKLVQKQLVGLPLRDTQCPFKVFTQDAASKLVPLCTYRGWAFDVEVLLAASRAGFRIVEQPVAWEFVGGSTVRADAGTIWRTLRDLVRLRFRTRAR